MFQESGMCNSLYFYIFIILTEIYLFSKMKKFHRVNQDHQKKLANKELIGANMNILYNILKKITTYWIVFLRTTVVYGEI